MLLPKVERISKETPYLLFASFVDSVMQYFSNSYFDREQHML